MVEFSGRDSWSLVVILSCGVGGLTHAAMECGSVLVVEVQ